MKRNYTFSNLPIAAIVLLVVSLPSFAQATAHDSTSVLTDADHGPTLALNKTSRAVFPSLEETPVTSKSVKRVKSLSNLSPAALKASEQVSGNHMFFSRPQLSNELYQPDAKKQFRSEDYTPTERPRFTFVPSRGPKLPN